MTAPRLREWIVFPRVTVTAVMAVTTVTAAQGVSA